MEPVKQPATRPELEALAKKYSLPSDWVSDWASRELSLLEARADITDRILARKAARGT